jgi:simple sugar transport system permease protein
LSWDAVLAQVVRLAIPYLFAAAGGVLAERAGVVSLALEGFMLAGGFGAVLGAFLSGSAWGGVMGGIVGGAIFGAIHALASIRFRADQVVSGIAINIMVLGLTRFLLQAIFGSAANSARVSGFAAGAGRAGASAIALLANPLVILGLASAPVLHWLLARTPFGLRVRATGDRPDAAESAGVPVARVQSIAVVGSGILAGLGGTFLALDQHQFTEGMTAGRGFIALAAVIFGRWEPLRAAAGCALFAAAEAAEIHLQGSSTIPTQWVQMIPYALTILALVGLVGRVSPPTALGRPR